MGDPFPDRASCSRIAIPIIKGNPSMFWTDTRYGDYDTDTHDGNTRAVIDRAYASYERAIDDLRGWGRRPRDVPVELDGELYELCERYDNQLFVNTRQNIAPLVEEPLKTITKACQYAQASLLRDLGPMYSRLAAIPRAKAITDRLFKLRPETISVKLWPQRPEVFEPYMHIRDPESAAEIIGKLNNGTRFVEYTSHMCITDSLLQELVSEALVAEYMVRRQLDDSERIVTELQLKDSVMAQSTVLGILFKDENFREQLDKARAAGSDAKEKRLLRKKLKDAQNDGTLSEEAVRTMWQSMYDEAPEDHKWWKFW